MTIRWLETIFDVFASQYDLVSCRAFWRYTTRNWLSMISINVQQVQRQVMTSPQVERYNQFQKTGVLSIGEHHSYSQLDEQWIWRYHLKLVEIFTGEKWTIATCPSRKLIAKASLRWMCSSNIVYIVWFYSLTWSRESQESVVRWSTAVEDSILAELEYQVPAKGSWNTARGVE